MNHAKEYLDFEDQQVNKYNPKVCSMCSANYSMSDDTVKWTRIIAPESIYSRFICDKHRTELIHSGCIVVTN